MTFIVRESALILFFTFAGGISVYASVSLSEMGKDVYLHYMGLLSVWNLK